MFEHLVHRIVWEELGSIALLEKVCYCGVVLPAICRSDGSSQLLHQHDAGLPARYHIPHHDGHRLTP